VRLRGGLADREAHRQIGIGLAVIGLPATSTLDIARVALLMIAPAVILLIVRMAAGRRLIPCSPG
jgi:hypothetical protein